MRSFARFGRDAAIALCVACPGLVHAQDAKPAPKPYTFSGDIGYVAVSGNQSLTTFSLGNKATYQSGLWLFTQQFNAVYSEANGAANAEFYRSLLRTDYALGKRFNLFGVLTWDRNRFAGIANKFEQQAGVSWKAVQGPADTLLVETGAGLVQQANLNGTELDFGASRTAARYRHVFSERASVQQFAEYILNVQNTADYRANIETSLVAPIAKAISVKLGYLVRYQSQPPFRPNVTPAQRFRTTDYVFTSGLQVSF
jgi:putative salt-induced outer membrane protein